MAHSQPVADIAFIAEFAAFCRNKGDEGYNYDSNTTCACAQFLRSSGRAQEPFVSGVVFAMWVDGPISTSEPHKFPHGMAHALSNGPHTFSALADRLEALIANAPSVVRA